MRAQIAVEVGATSTLEIVIDPVRVDRCPSLSAYPRGPGFPCALSQGVGGPDEGEAVDQPSRLEDPLDGLGAWDDLQA